MLDTSTSSPSECNAVLMTVKDSSFSFFEVGIASNKIETERELGGPGGGQRKTQKKMTLKMNFLKDFSGGEERAHSFISGGKNTFSRQGRLGNVSANTKEKERPSLKGNI